MANYIDTDYSGRCMDNINVVIYIIDVTKKLSFLIGENHGSNYYRRCNNRVGCNSVG